MRELRGALIGCGFFAVNHMHAWRDVPGVTIAAICDTDPARLKAMGEQFGIERRYDAAAALVAQEKLDFVDIATTVRSHRRLVELVARHGIAVICQKPFAPNLEDAHAMVAACEQAGVPLMVHENFRWQSPIQAAAKVIRSGEIGEVYWGRVSFRSTYDVYSGQPYLAEGNRFIIEDLGIHSLDVARYLFGEATRITTRTRRINPAIRGEDVATMLLDHAGGVTSIVDCSYATLLETEAFPQTLLEVDGSGGTLRLSAGYGMTVTTPAGSRHIDLSPPLLPWASRPWHNIQESVVAIEMHWADCLRAGIETATSGRDNLKTLALVEAAYLGAATGKTVSV
jgi:D-apiose dehydrogenase